MCTTHAHTSLTHTHLLLVVGPGSKHHAARLRVVRKSAHVESAEDGGATDRHELHRAQVRHDRQVLLVQRVLRARAVGENREVQLLTAVV